MLNKLDAIVLAGMDGWQFWLFFLLYWAFLTAGTIALYIGYLSVFEPSRSKSLTLRFLKASAFTIVPLPLLRKLLSVSIPEMYRCATELTGVIRALIA